MAIASVTITCSKCGKEFTVRANKSNRAEANNFEEWVRRNIDTCRECERAAKESAEKERDAAAGLPELVGSPKQISWARALRNDFIQSTEGETPEALEAVRLILKVKTSAKWWIDVREKYKCYMCLNVVCSAIYDSDEMEDKELVGEFERIGSKGNS